MGYTEVKKPKIDKDLCDLYLGDERMPIHGYKLDNYLQKTKIIKTEMIDNPTFDTGLFHRLLQIQKPKFTFTKDNSDPMYLAYYYFPSLFKLEQRKALIHIDTNNNYVLTPGLNDKKRYRNIIRWYPTITAITNMKSWFKTRSEIGMLYSDDKALNTYFDDGVNHINLDNVPVYNQLFDECSLSHADPFFAFTKFTYGQFVCEDKKPFENGFKRKANVKFWSISDYFNMEKLYSRMYADESPTTKLYAEVTFHDVPAMAASNLWDISDYMDTYHKVSNGTNSKISKKALMDDLIRRNQPFAFIAWIEKVDGKLYGCVENYGVLYKYDITNIGKEALKVLKKFRHEYHI
jgi:hypothetical protein